MSRIWPIPFTMIAGVAAFMAFIFWLSGRADRAPPQLTTITATQAQTTSGSSDWAAARSMCDKQVPILLNTADRLEFDRAAFLIRYLDCSVSSRLPR
jgi:hypothetical protein